MAQRFLLAGDSFVRRLEFHQHDLGEKLIVQGYSVDFVGLPGKGVLDVNRAVASLPCGLYQVVVLSVGGNDLCKASRTPAAVASDLVSLAEMLVAAGTAQVIICQLLRRARESHFQGLTLAEYNGRVDECNIWLSENCCGPQVFFWNHHHNVLGFNRLALDGVHLNVHGMRGFRRSIIQAFSFYR